LGLHTPEAQKIYCARPKTSTWMFIFIFSYIYNIYFIFSRTPADLKMYCSDIHSPEIYSAYDIRLHIIFMTYDLLFTSQQRPYHNNMMVVHRRTQVTTTGCSCGRFRVLQISVIFVRQSHRNFLDRLSYVLFVVGSNAFMTNKKGTMHIKVGPQKKKLIKIVDAIYSCPYFIE